MTASDGKKKEGASLRWRAWQSSLLAGGATATILVIAGPPPGSVWMVGALALAAGTLAGIAHARRLRILLLGTAVAVTTGVLSSIDFLQPDVEERFPAIAATIAVYLVLGFLAGAFLEMVFFLHYLTHGRDPAKYPDGERPDSGK